MQNKTIFCTSLSHFSKINARSKIKKSEFFPLLFCLYLLPTHQTAQTLKHCFQMCPFKLSTVHIIYHNIPEDILCVQYYNAQVNITHQQE